MKINQLKKILEFDQKQNLESLKYYTWNTKHLSEIYLHQVKTFKENDCVRETRFDLVQGAYMISEILP